MPSQQRFEGTDLEDLLAEVRGKYGPGVNIIEATKLRKGGVGGFFARELFEVVVELDDDMIDDDTIDGREPVRSPAPPSRTLLDLVDEVDDGPAPRVGDRDPLASDETIRALLAMTDGGPVVEERPAPAEGMPAPAEGIPALLAQLEDERARGTAAVRPTETTVSTDGDAFADVLRRIALSTQPTTPAPADDAPFRSYADLSRSARPEPTAAAVEPVVERPSTPAARPSTPVAGPGTAVEVAGTEPEAVALDSVLDLRHLGNLGLPSQLLEHPVTSLDSFGALVELARHFPTPRPLPDGDDVVIAVIGDLTGMESTVSWVQRQLGLSDEGLFLASRGTSKVFPRSRRIADHSSASTRRRSWRRRGEPVLVVIDQPVAFRTTSWARHILDALEPSAVWAVVDADRKPDDVVEWSEQIGGVDAVSLHGVDDTASPASILTTGLPVALIDGQPATPVKWAAVLDERLLAA